MVSTGNRLGKITLTVSLLFFGMSCTTLAQQPVSERVITINMGASEYLPADLIIFNVNINAEGETPQEAYELHSDRESLLATLLKELNIKDENIDYEPVRMNRRQIGGNRYNNDEKPKYITVTNQSVSITFNDFSLYEKIQLTLIENGFDSFNGEFSSTKKEEGREKALISAIEKARERAELIAKTSGVELGQVSNINYSESEVINLTAQLEMSKSSFDMPSPPNMMEFEQMVKVHANINISYFLE